MPITRADAQQALDALAARGLWLAAPEALSTHLEALGRRGAPHERWDDDPTGAALIAAAHLEPVVEPVLAALRAETLREAAGPPIACRGSDLEDAQLEVALALGWAWCALLGQPDGGPRDLWIVRGCLVTQRTLARRQRVPAADRLGIALDHATHALVRSSLLSSAEAAPGRLPHRSLAVGVGMLGVAHHLLGDLRPA